jgi:hypothetical protein
MIEARPSGPDIRMRVLNGKNGSDEKKREKLI